MNWQRETTTTTTFECGSEARDASNSLMASDESLPKMSVGKSPKTSGQQSPSCERGQRVVPLHGEEASSKSHNASLVTCA